MYSFALRTIFIAVQRYHIIRYHGGVSVGVLVFVCEWWCASGGVVVVLVVVVLAVVLSGNVQKWC